MLSESQFDGYFADLRRAVPSREKPSPAELRVIRCMSVGLTPRMAADALFLSHETIKSHLKNAKSRAAAKTTAHLVAICLREGWI